MKKNLLEIDLQLFADEVEDAGETEVAETADPQEDETSEEESSETVEEEDGNDEPQEQSPEENARYAAIRRRAEEDAKRKYDAELGAMNQRIAAMCQGVTHPVTGQPLKTVSEYIDALSAQQRIARERELQSKGIDPAMIDQMIAQNPVVQQAQQVIEKSRQNEAENLLLNDISEIGKYDPNIKTPQDINKIPHIEEMCDYCQRTGVRLFDAYKIFNFDTAKQNATDAGRQQAINQMRGKAHLPSQTQNLTTEEDFVEVPAEIMNSWKAEGKTEKQIRDLYKKVASKLHIS